MTDFCYIIAGSDSTGGAGIQTDLRTVTRLDCYGIGTLTCIVSFDPRNNWNHRVFPIPTDIIVQQFEAATSTYQLEHLKIGMLGSVETIDTVTELIKQHPFQQIVLDPVLICKGQEQSAALAIDQELVKVLLPHAHVVTPNLFEAETLSKQIIRNITDMREAAKKIADLGPQVVVIKGGTKLGNENAIDLLYDGSEFIEFTLPLAPDRIVSGAGCSFASAISAYLSKGEKYQSAVESAKDFVYQAITNSIQTAAPFRSINQINA